jgi:hypothetical protein
VYDGDGKRVKGTVSGVTTTYIGNYFEWSGSTSTMKKYYYSGATRVAMRVGSTLSWLLSDHLGSTAITTNSGGTRTGELRYRAWGLRGPGSSIFLLVLTTGSIFFIISCNNRITRNHLDTGRR